MLRANAKKSKGSDDEEEKKELQHHNGVKYSLNIGLIKRLNLITFLSIIGTVLICINLYLLHRLSSAITINEYSWGYNYINENETIKRPKVWIQGRNIETGYLKHVFDVFKLIGYETVDGNDSNWDVLFSHDYPFTKDFFDKILPHQRVNHYPGSGYITNKVSLATSNIKHMPKAFALPDEKELLKKYAKDNPETLWVQKSNDHRGIRVEQLKNLDLNMGGTFIQKYIQNPLLIDGKKFDIGVYVTMTSVKPLRVYIYDNDFLLRFCYNEYHPFNSSQFDSYVVTDDYTPTWDIPSLRKYFLDLNLNMKQSLSGYLRSIGKDPEPVYAKMEEAIARVYTDKQKMMTRLANMYGQRHFFEMVRFDFLLDEDLNVYLMEANMSPNLSSLHFAPNKLLYEQVIYNTLSLAGLSRILENKSWFNYSGVGWDMRVSEKDLSVFQDLCVQDECHLSCRLEKCKICHYCLTEEMKVTLKDAYLEHGSRCNYKRIIPSTDENAVQSNEELDVLQHQWVLGKCIQDSYWC